jgi:hypothetical protein
MAEGHEREWDARFHPAKGNRGDFRQGDGNVTQEMFPGDISAIYDRDEFVTKPHEFTTSNHTIHDLPIHSATSSDHPCRTRFQPAACGGNRSAGTGRRHSPIQRRLVRMAPNKPGTLYKNKENPILQGFNVGGRFQYQAAYLDGSDVNGRDFNDTYDEYRRVRIETKVDFLQFFSANIKINMVNDDRRSGGDLDWGYEDFDEAVFTFDIKKAFGAGALDELKLNYGRFKFLMTEEVHMSSKEIYTVERSAIANKLYGANSRPTGVTLDAALGKWSGTLGLFSGEDDSEFIGGWNDGEAYYLSLFHDTTDEWRLGLDFVINDESGADDFLGYAWAAAFNAIYEKDRFGAVSTIAIGENNGNGIRGGSFHALMVMPYYWIVEDRLQAVVQYQYAGASESEGITHQQPLSPRGTAPAWTSTAAAATNSTRSTPGSTTTSAATTSSSWAAWNTPTSTLPMAVWTR